VAPVKALAAVLAVAALAGGGAYLWLESDSGDPEGSGESRDAAAPEREQGGPDGLEASGPGDPAFAGSACRRLAGVAAALAGQDLTPLETLRELGRRVAGIRPPPRAFGDLARGGRDLLPGRGFLARYDDGTSGQARHFAGIAVATTIVGGAVPTRLISERLRDDPSGSADGRLTEAGIEFSQELRSGDLTLGEAPAWILENLCRRR
jgi:hypothetical protein